jgi:GABA(A) receptor-associated protein
MIYKYPDKKPLIFHNENEDDVKMMADQNMSFAELVYNFRKKKELKPEQALFFFIDSKLLPNHLTVSQIHELYQSRDGFVYVNFYYENTFGMKNVHYEDEHYIFKCPHCSMMVIVHDSETNCCIFRYGVFKDTFKQMDPHTRKEDCDRLASEGRIYGCGKPFKMEYNKFGYYVIKCGYI